jgi:sigma-B regulation protein RsbU (phosphoserine phosphatase)
MWANVTITALRNLEGELIGFAKVTRDLTERREAEENRRALAAEKAALAEKAKIHEFQERFLAILGHDLRNPLASINIGAGVVRQRASDPVTLRVATRMRESSQRMSRMIEQILDLTRTRLAGGLELRVEPFDLRDTIRRVVEELHVAHPARSVTVISPPLPGRWDKDRLEQVFSNLVGNALVYGEPEQPVVVRARVESRFVVVEVHNDGPPIPDDLRVAIFDPFRRGQQDTHPSRRAGLGLGLYISKEVTLAHGGDITVRSTVAEGTTFQVTLPAEPQMSKKETSPP